MSNAFDAFDDVVASMDGAMVVVTVAAAGEADGCLVGFHSQCSIEPRRYAVWLSKANRTYELAGRATHLAVHLLAADDHDLAEQFGGVSGDDVDKLAGMAWAPAAGGAPVLGRCPSWFVGRIVSREDHGGDHVLHVIEPEAAAHGGPGAPLRLGATGDIDPGHDASERR